MINQILMSQGREASRKMGHDKKLSKKKGKGKGREKNYRKINTTRNNEKG